MGVAQRCRSSPVTLPTETSYMACRRLRFGTLTLIRWTTQLDCDSQSNFAFPKER